LGIRVFENWTMLAVASVTCSLAVAAFGAAPFVEPVLQAATGMGLPDAFRNGSPVSAVGLLIAGGAGILAHRGRPVPVLISGLAVIVSAILILLQIRLGSDLGLGSAFLHATEENLPTDTLRDCRAMSAICLLIAGSALLASAIDRLFGDEVSTTTVILQVLLAAAGAVALSGSLIEAPLVTPWARITYLPPLTSSAFAVLGLGLFARSWAMGQIYRKPAQWLPAAAFISALAVTVSIWQLLHAEERNLIVGTTQATGDFSAEALFLFGLVMATSLAFAIAAAQRAHRAADEALAYAARFRHAERIANLFHWKTGPRLDQWEYASENAEKFYGVSLDEFLGGTGKFPTIIYRGDRARVLALYHSLNENPQPFVIEYRFLHPDDGIRFCREVGEPIFDAKGILLSFRGTTQDITEKRNTEAQLLDAKADAENANRAKSEFLAHMSHELRTPLNSIIGFSQMISTQVFGAIGNAKYEGYITVIERSAQHLLSLINDVLDLTKVEAGKVELSESLLDVEDLAQEAVDLVFGTTNSRSVVYRIDPVVEQNFLFGDRRLVLQCFTNLLSNARKFTPESGTVTIDMRLSKDYGFRIAVSDTGIGIAEDKLEQVMEPFSQVRPDVQHSTEGTGLGLAIVKRLIELHGGRIVINSKLGDGTTVTLFFPQDRTIPADSTEMRAASA